MCSKHYRPVPPSTPFLLQNLLVLYDACASMVSIVYLRYVFVLDEKHARHEKAIITTAVSPCYSPPRLATESSS